MSGIWTDRNAAWADRDLLWEPRTASAATPRLGAALRAVAPTGATTVAATVAALAAVCLARQPVIRTGLREVLRLTSPLTTGISLQSALCTTLRLSSPIEIEQTT